jgi:hypothetical protein
VNTIIRYFRNKINILETYLTRRDILIIIVIVSVSITSFALGFHAGDQKPVPVVTVKDNSCIAPVTQASIANGESLAQGNSTIVASKNGSRYYFVWCSGASRIAPQNRMYFETIQEAEKKGYTKASGCE